ncbi:MAG: hypothetical protein IIA88_08235 [Bacteroidetes bacterium]|nr:hypothetical protein [Bacteroidota bacterium]
MTNTIISYQQQLSTEIKRVPVEYLPNLLKIVRSFRETVNLKPAEESFRQGWQEAMKGEHLPISELWKDIDGK